jgi:hypothetical protein
VEAAAGMADSEIEFFFSKYHSGKIPNGGLTKVESTIGGMKTLR